MLSSQFTWEHNPWSLPCFLYWFGSLHNTTCHTFRNMSIMSILTYIHCICTRTVAGSVTTPHYKLIDLIAGSLGVNMNYIWGYTFSSYLLIMYIIPLCLLSFTNYHLIKIIRFRKCFHRNRNNSENKVQLYLFIIHLFIVYNEVV